jgi:LacI family transcriptional regulator
MENKKGIYPFLLQMAEKGRKTVGFIGNMKHCRSFFERGAACMSAAAYYGYEPVQPYSVLDYPPRQSPARVADSAEELYVKLQSIPALPEILICANDFIAINLISSLRRMGVRCPEDVLVLGFDDSPESRFHSPSLSTVHIHTQGMGRIAAELLLGRITDISREYRITFMPTELILRESTGSGII